jgi:hypothetical protein
MATKKKATNAPASKKPVAKKPRGNPLPPGKTHDGRLNRAQKSAANKAVTEFNIAAAKDTQAEVIAATKTAGKQATMGLVTTPAIQQNKGRPWEYARVEWTDQLGNALFTLISTGHSMREIAEIEGMPPVAQMLVWLGEKEHPFVEIRTRAKDLLVPLYEEMAQHLTLNTNKGTITVERQVVTKDGDVVDTVETRYIDNVERSKLALQGIQWTLGHLKPKKHGRSPDNSGEKPNEQLEGLFAALKAGPKE